MNNVHVQCSDCKTLYQKPDGPIEDYYCPMCGNTTLVVPAASPSEQATLGVVGAALGLALGGVPGAIVGGILGLLAGSEK